MSRSDDDKFWYEVVKPLRKKLGFSIPTPEEADKAYNEAPEEPISSERIEEIVRFATQKEKNMNFEDLGPLPSINPRESTVQKASTEIKNYIYHIQEVHQLTSTELNYVIVDFLKNFASILISIERSQNQT